MIVRIEHVWYKEKRYDLSNEYDVIEFMHDLRAVTQFVGDCIIKKVRGDV